MNNVPDSGNYSSSFNGFVYNRIPELSKVLDVGCWTGNLGQKLIDNKRCVVDGVDVDKGVLKKAEESGYRKLYAINLNNDPLPGNKISDLYDVVVFADVLEHLVYPERILKYFKDCLKDDGRVVVSLPNVAFLLNRLRLFFGNWEYTEFGTLDKTHLKFYTIKSGQQLLERNGFVVEEVVPYNQFGILSRINFLNKLLPNLFSYQFMIIARKNKDGSKK